VVRIQKTGRRHWWHGALLSAVIVLSGCITQAAESPGAGAGATQVAAATTPMRIKGHLVNVELAITGAEQELGLMNRAQMPADRGMLFVFAKVATQAFWMKNTRLPLSIAFIAADKTIVNIADMAPLDEVTIHRSGSPVQYALEVNQGWFAANGIASGDTCEFILPTSVQPLP
jgi:uncharacterized membrane protein (UPF0127 family)